jgi:prepilin-type N-terminal cleavage/methylation domain-containing protein
VSSNREGLSGVRARRAGFTLLEVMMAVLVLGTALVALVKMLTLGRLSAEADAMRAVAHNILRREAELVQAQGYASVTDQAAAVIAGEPDYTRSVAVASAGDGLKRVTLTVSWDSPTGVNVSESLEFLVADTVLPVRTLEVP